VTTPSALLSDLSQPLTLPMPEPLFQIILSGLFLMHAVFMNLLLGGSLVLVVTEILRRSDPHTDITRFSGIMAARLPMAFFFAVILGLVSLMGVQVLYGPVFKEAAGIIGHLWVVAGGGLLAGYAGLHVNRWRGEWLDEHSGQHLLILCGTAGSLLGVALVFVVMSVIMLKPEMWVESYGAGVADVLAIATVWPRFVHMICAAIAGVGMCIAGYGVYLRSQWHQAWAAFQPGEEEFGLWVTRFGVIWTLIGTLPQIVVGPWLLMGLPDAVRHHLVAGDTYGSLAFFLALTSALFSLVLLNAALMVPSVRGFVVTGVTSLFLTMGCMVIVRETVRFVQLTPTMVGTRLPSELPWIMILVMIVVSMVGGSILWRRLHLAGKFARTPIAPDLSERLLP